MKSYFNSVGFERWNKIYGTTDDINSVRQTPCRPNICLPGVVGSMRQWLCNGQLAARETLLCSVQLYGN